MNTSTAVPGPGKGRVSVATIDATGWGLFFIWVGIALIADISWGVALLVTGLISLGSQLARGVCGFAVDGWSVVFGTCLLVAGLVEWLEIPLEYASLPSWIVPAVFVILGMAVLMKVWMRGHKS